MTTSDLQIVPDIWYDIKGYEGIYKVNRRGDVLSLEREVVNEIGVIKTIKTKVLKRTHLNNGYSTVSLWKNRIKTTHLVHRIIAEAFIENPMGKKQVNHINGDKSDNAISNLEWVTQSENTIHAYKIGLFPKEKRKGCKRKRIIV